MGAAVDVVGVGVGVGVGIVVVGVGVGVGVGVVLEMVGDVGLKVRYVVVMLLFVVEETVEMVVGVLAESERWLKCE